MPFLTVAGMNLCVSWLDRYEAEGFNSNGHNRIVELHLKREVFSGSGMEPGSVSSSRVSWCVSESVFGHALRTAVSGYLKGECGKSHIVHDWNQRRAGRELSCLSPSAPVMPPRLLAHGLVSLTFKMSECILLKHTHRLIPEVCPTHL